MFRQGFAAHGLAWGWGWRLFPGLFLAVVGLLPATGAAKAAGTTGSAEFLDWARKLGAENFEDRNKASAFFRRAIREGKEQAVRKALQKILGGTKSAEAAQRGKALLQMCSGGPIVRGLRASLLLKGAEPEKGIRLQPPFEAVPKLRIRLMNLSEHPVQVVRSSYVKGYFFNFHVRRLKNGKADGKPLRYSRDLYPEKKMVFPHKEYVTLQPGQGIERDVTLVLKEGYLVRTLGSQALFLKEMQREGRGAMRKPGSYQVLGVYAVAAEKNDRHFRKIPSGGPPNLKRNKKIPLWKGPEVVTQALQVEITSGKSKPAAKK